MRITDTFRPGSQWVSCVTLFCLGLLVACSLSDPMEQAREKQAEGDFAGAIEPLRVVLAQDPNNPEALYRIGLSLNRTGQSTMALWSLLRATEDPEWHEKAAFEAVSAAFGARNWDESIKLMDGVLEVDPDNIEALQIRAHTRIRSRQGYDQALADADRVLEIDPENQNILPDRAAALIGLKRFDEAEDAFAGVEAVFRESSPSEDLTARFCVANAMFAAEDGRLEEAEELYEGCFEDFGDAEVTFTGILGFYDFIEREDRIFEILEEQIEKDPSAQVYRYELVRRLEKLERFDEAEQLLLDDIELAEEGASAGIWFDLGRHHMIRGNYAAAADATKQGIDQTPNPTPNLLAYYAEALLYSERFEEALAVADEMTVPAYQHLIRARVALARSDPETALEYFGLSQKTWPENSVSRYYAARSAEQIGDFDRAIAEYRYAIRSDPSQSDSDRRLARILSAQGDDAGAYEILQQATRESDSTAESESTLLAVELLAALGRSRPLGNTLTTLSQSATPEELARAAARAAGGAARAFGPEAGLKILTRWIQFDFTAVANGEVLAQRSELEAQAGRPEVAQQLAEAAIEAHPDEATFHEILAAAQARNGASPDLVLRSYQRALELDATRTPSMLALARHDAEIGNPASAITRVETFLDANPESGSPEVSRQYAEWLAETGRGEEARDQIRNLLIEDPTDVASALALARWHLDEKGGNPKRARIYVQQAQRFGGGDSARDLADRLSEEPSPREGKPAP